MKKKLTRRQIIEIVNLREIEHLSYRKLAQIYGVCVSAIYSILNPEYYKRQLKLNADRRKHQRKWKIG